MMLQTGQQFKNDNMKEIKLTPTQKEIYLAVAGNVNFLRSEIAKAEQAQNYALALIFESGKLEYTGQPTELKDDNLIIKENGK